MFATDQNGIEFQHVVTGFAVLAAALAAGIGGNHAANSGAVGGRKLRGEKQPMGLERGVKLILDYPSLHAHLPCFHIDLNDLVHVTGDIHHDAVGKRLTVGAGAAAPRR